MINGPIEYTLYSTQNTSIHTQKGQKQWYILLYINAWRDQYPIMNMHSTQNTSNYIQKR